MADYLPNVLKAFLLKWCQFSVALFREIHGNMEKINYRLTRVKTTLFYTLQSSFCYPGYGLKINFMARIQFSYTAKSAGEDENLCDL